MIIPQYKFTQIINLGIAGTLKNNLKVGDFISVRTLYLVQDLKPSFKTFQADPEGVDCITSFERILNLEKAQPLKGIGDLVDREAWGVAMAAKTAGLPFRSYKVISDLAGTMEACELVRLRASEFSEKLAEGMSHILHLTKKVPEKLNLPGFHFTHSTEHRFLDLVHKLAIKNEKTMEEILGEMKHHELKTLDLLPKERTKRLLEMMNHLIDPTKKKIQEKIQFVVNEFSKNGFKLHIDSQLENPKVSITFEVQEDKELHEKAEHLKNLSLAEFTKIMNGDLNVE
jgi:hypothetical protein